MAGGADPFLKDPADFADIPSQLGMGGVVQHLPDNLPADFRTALPLGFHQGRDGILVNKQVIQRPAVSAADDVGNALLPVNQDEPAGISRVHLFPGKQTGIIRYQLLQLILRGKGFLLHRLQPAQFVQVVNVLLGQGLALLLQVWRWRNR